MENTVNTTLNNLSLEPFSKEEGQHEFWAYDYVIIFEPSLLKGFIHFGVQDYEQGEKKMRAEFIFLFMLLIIQPLLEYLYL